MADVGGAAGPPAGPPLVRAAAWSALAGVLAEQGRRDRALVAARTALALLDRAGAGEGPTEAARAQVRHLTGPLVVPLHVDLAGGAGADGPGGPGSAGEARAVWLGAGDPVLAMLGWVERDGALEVVRAVVPGTRRGRGAFAILVGALPEQVPVTMLLPARDGALTTVCRRAGFAVVEGSLSSRGHVGGSLRVHRGGGAT